ncbi:unnamed protein product [Anisakis simplex]|uniref:Uncharacterized protein n=1 Tax=Anisakis simplex TaxID=6269 RepID=A0A0M3JLT2_ANISI|nr:unnamed protein product [Anisakis simplex]
MEQEDGADVKIGTEKVDDTETKRQTENATRQPQIVVKNHDSSNKGLQVSPEISPSRDALSIRGNYTSMMVKLSGNAIRLYRQTNAYC